jgi:hypothetical protein
LVQSLIDFRQICLSSYVLGEGLLPKVQCATQLPSFPLDGHGTMLKPTRPEEYDSPLPGSEKQFVRWKHKLPFWCYFSCPSPTEFPTKKCE